MCDYKIKIPDQYYNDFISIFKIGILKELHKNNIISEIELNKLIKLQNNNKL